MDSEIKFEQAPKLNHYRRKPIFEDFIYNKYLVFVDVLVNPEVIEFNYI